jgi:hypothetical protein
MMDPAQQLEGMTKRYNLSADQQTQLKPILASQQQQMQALRGDSSLSREDRMAKMQSIRADTKTKIEAVLNDDQLVPDQRFPPKPPHLHPDLLCIIHGFASRKRLSNFVSWCRTRRGALQGDFRGC